jgi:hypothetical protein
MVFVQDDVQPIGQVVLYKIDFVHLCPQRNYRQQHEHERQGFFHHQKELGLVEESGKLGEGLSPPPDLARHSAIFDFPSVKERGKIAKNTPLPKAQATFAANR